MPVAICNTCDELVMWRAGPHQHLKDQRCKCGSADLTAVGGKWNADMSGMVYHDRKGNFKKYVPRITNEILKPQYANIKTFKY